MKMKRFLFLLITLFLMTEVQGQTNWSIVSQSGINLVIVDQTTGYSYVNETTGSHGMRYKLKKSTDGFQSFTTIRTKSGSYGCYWLDEMYYVAADTGFIAEVCQGIASIYKTTDGGQTWTPTGYGGFYGMSMCFRQGNNRYYAFSHPGGRESYFLKNGTVVYTTKKYVFANDVSTTKISFINDSIGFIICKDVLGNGVILKTTDFGTNWSEKMILSNNQFKDVFFVTENIGFVVGTNGTILRTDDSGENWQNVVSNTSSCLNSIDFSNDSIGYIVGNGGEMLKTK